MLSRIQSLSQLYIYGQFTDKNLKYCPIAYEETLRLESESLKNFNNESLVILTSLNIRSLVTNFDILQNQLCNFSKSIIIFQESWLSETTDISELQIPNMSLSVNSVRRGAGIGAYLGSEYKNIENIQERSYQISAYTSTETVVVNVYRSKDSKIRTFTSEIINFLKKNDSNKTTILVGDFNIEFSKEKKSTFQTQIENEGFTQLIEKPTHESGNQIDALFMRNPKLKYKVIQQSNIFLDHDIINLTLGETDTLA